MQFEVVIEIVNNDYNSTFMEEIGTKKRLILSDIGYKNCRADKSVKIVAAALITE